MGQPSSPQVHTCSRSTARSPAATKSPLPVFPSPIAPRPAAQSTLKNLDLGRASVLKTPPRRPRDPRSSPAQSVCSISTKSPSKSPTVRKEVRARSSSIPPLPTQFGIGTFIAHPEVQRAFFPSSAGHQRDRSSSPVRPTSPLPCSSPIPQHQRECSLPLSEAGLSTADTQLDPDPIHDAYKLGYYNGRVEGRKDALIEQKAVKTCNSSEVQDTEPVSTAGDLTLVASDEPDSPKSRVPTPDIISGCELTPATRKRIAAELQPAHISLQAVKRFKVAPYVPDWQYPERM
ncbi:uncharacterized protein TRAVEDRAFT_53593 [Trametes versicolor FP-101664 SS1]|nr:uncharacterized protein TRAVEDRAFT_53593 [Trametes versicolor FP-101664 SS1]EIW52170.1 hypothetical protein TRAVEDRAFT_53593 [Trametes versicolor FP-101664 SS1]